MDQLPLSLEDNIDVSKFNIIDIQPLTTAQIAAFSPAWPSTATNVSYVPYIPSASPYMVGSTYNTTYDTFSIRENTGSGVIKLTGEKADIDINGVSLTQTLKSIQSRLAILQPNTKLESEWEELKVLGDRYRALEIEIKEKMKMWDVLNTPLPEK